MQIDPKPIPDEDYLNILIESLSALNWMFYNQAWSTTNKQHMFKLFRQLKSMSEFSSYVYTLSVTPIGDTQAIVSIDGVTFPEAQVELEKLWKQITIKQVIKMVKK